jgi:hypothetical protein
MRDSEAASMPGGGRITSFLPPPPRFSSYGPPPPGSQPLTAAGYPPGYPRPPARRKGGGILKVLLVLVLIAAVILGVPFLLRRGTPDAGATKYATPGGTYSVTFPLTGKIITDTLSDGIVMYGVVNASNTVGYFLYTLNTSNLTTSAPPGVTGPMLARYVVDNYDTPQAEQGFASSSGFTNVQVHEGVFEKYQAAYLSATDTEGGFIPGLNHVKFSGIIISVGSSLIIFADGGGSTSELTTFSHSFSTKATISLYNLSATPSATITAKVAQARAASE